MSDFLSSLCLLNMDITQMVWAMVVLYIFIALMALLYLFFIRFYITYRMAKNRHKDPTIWVLISLFVSPIFTWIVLFLIGDEQ